MSLIWLQQDLASTNQEWIIAFWHHPPYSKGSHDSDSAGEPVLREMRERFLPVLDAYGVDLVLTGHSHSYERSLLLRDHYGLSSSYNPVLHAVDAGDGDPAGDGAYQKPALGPIPDSGAVHSVVGSSSQISGGPLNHVVMRVSLNVLGSMVIDVEGNRLDGTFLGVSGNVLDHFRLEKGPPISDQDQDGAADASDNCLLEANPSQLDTDQDGYGNLCDADFDDNGSVNVLDLGLLRFAYLTQAGAPNWNPETDANGDGFVNPIDLGEFRAAFLGVPGPSGLACAGTPPCPAR
jgi:hypothetical protein